MNPTRQKVVTTMRSNNNNKAQLQGIAAAALNADAQEGERRKHPRCALRKTPAPIARGAIAVSASAINGHVLSSSLSTIKKDDVCNENTKAIGKKRIDDTTKNKKTENENRARDQLQKCPDFDNNFSVHQVLGRGTFGVVFKTRYNSTGDIYAVKVAIPRSNATFSESVTEWKNMKQLSHRNVVNLAFNFVSQYAGIETRLLGFRLAEKGDLAHFIRNQKEYNVYMARPVFKQLVAGLEYIHSQGMVHADFKPGNILVFNDKGHGNAPLVKISDLGGAKRMDKDGKVKEYSSTPCFRPPEAWDKHRINKIKGKPADMWSLGCTLYYMLTFGTAYAFDNWRCNFTLEYQIRNGLLVWPGEHLNDKRTQIPISNAAKWLVHGLTMMSPLKRFTVHQVKNFPWTQEDVQLEEWPEPPRRDAMNMGIRWSETFGENIKFSQHRFPEVLVVGPFFDVRDYMDPPSWTPERVAKMYPDDDDTTNIEAKDNRSEDVTVVDTQPKGAMDPGVAKNVAPSALPQPGQVRPSISETPSRVERQNPGPSRYHHPYNHAPNMGMAANNMEIRAQHGVQYGNAPQYPAFAPIPRQPFLNWGNELDNYPPAWPHTREVDPRGGNCYYMPWQIGNTNAAPARDPISDPYSIWDQMMMRKQWQAQRDEYLDQQPGELLRRRERLIQHLADQRAMHDQNMHGWNLPRPARYPPGLMQMPPPMPHQPQMRPKQDGMMSEDKDGGVRLSSSRLQ